MIRRLALAFISVMIVLIFVAEVQRLDADIEAGEFSGLAKVQGILPEPLHSERAP